MESDKYCKRVLPASLTGQGRMISRKLNGYIIYTMYNLYFKSFLIIAFENGYRTAPEHDAKYVSGGWYTDDTSETSQFIEMFK